jgi:hypothetical protein
VLHVLVFGLTTFICLLVPESRSQKWVGLFSICALAIGIEAGQCVVFHQTMEWADVLLDCLGSLSAFGLILSVKS